MGKYRYKLKRRVHRRGGSVSITPIDDVTNWGMYYCKIKPEKKINIGILLE